MAKENPADLTDENLLIKLDRFGVGVNAGYQAAVKRLGSHMSGAAKDLDPAFSHARWIALLKEMDKRNL